MTTLSPAGTQLVQDVARRYGVSDDAVTHMLMAVYNGNGSMAQFNHREFGGSGQWMRGGMTMVSDLFNNQLKYLVDNVCNDLSNGISNHQTTPFNGSYQSQSQNGLDSQSQAAGRFGSKNSLFVPDPAAEWWPHNLGSPSAVGSQNNMRYAYFADSRRLAVTTGGAPWVYDTLDHRIGGFGQQQGGGQSITFTSQYGTVNLSALPVVSRDGVAVAPAPAATPFQAPLDPVPSVVSNAQDAKPSQAVAAPSLPTTSTDTILLLERLGELMDKGYISKDEFAAKKSELLSRL